MGKYLSQEVRAKITGEKNGMFGRKRPEIGELNRKRKGMKRPDITGEKHPMFGKHHTEEAIRKDREAHKRLWENPIYRQEHIGENSHMFGRRGEKAPNWMGGISFFPYPVMFNSSLKQLIYQRDKGQCQNPDCEHRSGILDNHHIDYSKQNCHPLNLILLCRGCNAKANFHRQEWVLLYKEIARRNSTEHFTRTSYHFFEKGG
ncbi:MAG: NUMOD3 domain-containing DNA-binding protein [Desulfobacterales bacterium]|nr:NUMOD3 domain-containing DNA-binding protein [Desulfobacterales bacterium]